MHTIIRITVFVLLSGFLQQECYSQKINSTTKHSSMDTTKKNPVYSKTDSSKVVLSEEEWKKLLPSEVFQIARMKGTERPWTSKFENFKEIGTYYCAACGNPLFRSDSKFRSRLPT